MRAPWVLLRAGRYLPDLKLKPAEVHFVLTLMSHKHIGSGKPIRVHWETLAQDMGMSKNSVRTYARDLKTRKLLRVVQRRGRGPDDRPGYRNESNEFDLSPLVAHLERAESNRREDSAARGAGREDGGGEA